MEPCQYVRVLVGELAVKLAAPSTGPGMHSSCACYCRLRLGRLPPVSASVAIHPSPPIPVTSTFDLASGDVGSDLRLRIAVYAGSRGRSCGFGRTGRLLGRVEIPVSVVTASTGWMALGRQGSEVHLSVRAETNARFVFEFDGEPECSPQVLQVRGGIRQPVFTCKFSCRSATADRCQRSISLHSDDSDSRTWLCAFGSGGARTVRERKGWSVIVHNLFGSPVALASMVTPFVASPGKDHVSCTNPGAWLVLRRCGGTWKPWGRLEAWRERNDRIGFRFELSSGALVVESSASMQVGGRFVIDLATSTKNGSDPGRFIMSSTVAGKRGCCRKPTVVIGAEDGEDAAAFVALAAAVDLSMDACRLFSQKLRRELCGGQR